MNSRGFSLVELLVVLAVLAFAATLAAPAASVLSPELKAGGVADRIAGELRLARSHAVMQGRAVRLTVEREENRLRIGGDEEAVRRRNDWIASPRGVTIDVDDRDLANGDGNDLVFYPDGSASRLEIRLAGKKTQWIILTGLSGKTTVQKIPD